MNALSVGPSRTATLVLCSYGLAVSEITTQLGR